MIHIGYKQSESYLHYYSKLVFIEGLAGKKTKIDNTYPSNDELIASGFERDDSKLSSSFSYHIEQPIKNHNDRTIFVPDITMEDHNSIWLIEIEHLNELKLEKLAIIQSWATKCKKHVKLYKIPAKNLILLNKYQLPNVFEFMSMFEVDIKTLMYVRQERMYKLEIE